MDDRALALRLQKQYDQESHASSTSQHSSSDEFTENDDILAKQLQEQFDQELASSSSSSSSSISSPLKHKCNKPMTLVDERWELLDPNPDARALFLEFNDSYFWGRLAGVEVRWSPRMTLCAGLCCYEGRGGLCSIRLSLPLLKLRPRKDLVETLLHEMIHAYLFVTDNNKDHDGHGPEFCKHMNRLNTQTGTSISIYHTFHDEVDNYRQHWWKCDGPCQKRKPYFGLVRRAMNRAPSHRDPWWAEHQRTCGGTYHKIKEPENYGKKKGKKASKDSTGSEASAVPDKKSKYGADIRELFKGKGVLLAGGAHNSKASSSNTKSGENHSKFVDSEQKNNTSKISGTSFDKVPAHSASVKDSTTVPDKSKVKLDQESDMHSVSLNSSSTESPVGKQLGGEMSSSARIEMATPSRESVINARKRFLDNLEKKTLTKKNGAILQKRLKNDPDLNLTTSTKMPKGDILTAFCIKKMPNDTLSNDLNLGRKLSTPKAHFSSSSGTIKQPRSGSLNKTLTNPGNFVPAQKGRSEDILSLNGTHRKAESATDPVREGLSIPRSSGESELTRSNPASSSGPSQKRLGTVSMFSSPVGISGQPILAGSNGSVEMTPEMTKVQCPVCQTCVIERDINGHLDSCLR